jgi:hypothetical protein
MRTTAVLGGATASIGFDQLQLTQSQSSIKSRSQRRNRLGAADMMRRMMLLLAGNSSGSSVHGWPGRRGW